MRQINFVMIFVICLALVLFGIENTEPVSIKVTEGLNIQAPLSIELIVAMGIGAVLAWVFSVWVKFQRLIDTRIELNDRDARIETLEEDIQRYKAVVEEQQALLPGSSASIE